MQTSLKILSGVPSSASVHLPAGVYLELSGTHLPGFQRRLFMGSCLTRGSLLTKGLKEFAGKLLAPWSRWRPGAGAAVHAGEACAGEAVHTAGARRWGSCVWSILVQQKPRKPSTRETSPTARAGNWETTGAPGAGHCSSCVCSGGRV